MSHVRLGLLFAVLWCSFLLSTAQAQVAYWQGKGYSPETYTNMLWHTDGMCVSLRQQLGLPRFNGPGSRALSEYRAWKASQRPSSPAPSPSAPAPEAGFVWEQRTVQEQREVCQKVCINGVCQWVNVSRPVSVTRWVKVRVKEPVKQEQAEEEPAEEDLQATPMPVVKRMVEVSGAGYGKCIWDMGSRDGRILVEAARRGAQVVGVEIDAKWAKVARRALADEVLPGVVIEGDMFAQDPSLADIVFIYQHEDLLPRIVEMLSPGTVVVSYAHEPPGMDARRYEEGGQVFYVGTVQGPVDTAVEPAESILENRPKFIIPQKLFGLSR